MTTFLAVQHRLDSRDPKLRLAPQHHVETVLQFREEADAVIKAHPQAEEYTALSDRMSYLLLLRLGMALVVVAWAAIRPEVLGTSFAELVGITTGYLAAACARRVGAVAGLGASACRC